MPLSKRQVLDPFEYAHPGLYEHSAPSDVLDDTSFACVTGAIGQVAQVAAFATEIMDNVLRVADETRLRIEAARGKAEDLADSLLEVEDRVREAAKRKGFSCNTVVKRKHERKIPTIMTKATNDDAVIAQYFTCSLPPELWKFDDTMGAGAVMERFSNPNYFFREWLQAETKRQQEEKRQRIEEKKAAKKKKRERKQKEKEREKREQEEAALSDGSSSKKMLVSLAKKASRLPSTTGNKGRKSRAVNDMAAAAKAAQEEARQQALQEWELEQKQHEDMGSERDVVRPSLLETAMYLSDEGEPPKGSQSALREDSIQALNEDSEEEAPAAVEEYKSTAFDESIPATRAGEEQPADEEVPLDHRFGMRDSLMVQRQSADTVDAEPDEPLRPSGFSSVRDSISVHRSSAAFVSETELDGASRDQFAASTELEMVEEEDEPQATMEDAEGGKEWYQETSDHHQQEAVTGGWDGEGGEGGGEGHGERRSQWGEAVYEQREEWIWPSYERQLTVQDSVTQDGTAAEITPIAGSAAEHDAQSSIATVGEDSVVSDPSVPAGEERSSTGEGERVVVEDDRAERHSLPAHDELAESVGTAHDDEGYRASDETGGRTSTVRFSAVVKEADQPLSRASVGFQQPDPRSSRVRFSETVTDPSEPEDLHTQASVWSESASRRSTVKKPTRTSYDPQAGSLLEDHSDEEEEEEDQGSKKSGPGGGKALWRRARTKLALLQTSATTRNRSKAMVSSPRQSSSEEDEAPSRQSVALPGSAHVDLPARTSVGFEDSDQSGDEGKDGEARATASEGESEGQQGDNDGKGASDWEPVIDESTGKTYFVNYATNESSWTDPRLGATVTEREADGGGGAGGTAPEEDSKDGSETSEEEDLRPIPPPFPPDEFEPIKCMPQPRPTAARNPRSSIRRGGRRRMSGLVVPGKRLTMRAPSAEPATPQPGSLAAMLNAKSQNLKKAAPVERKAVTDVRAAGNMMEMLQKVKKEGLRKVEVNAQRNEPEHVDDAVARLLANRERIADSSSDEESDSSDSCFSDSD